jgi:hypothetical protein
MRERQLATDGIKGLWRRWKGESSGVVVGRIGFLNGSVSGAGRR